MQLWRQPRILLLDPSASTPSLRVTRTSTRTEVQPRLLPLWEQLDSGCQQTPQPNRTSSTSNNRFWSSRSAFATLHPRATVYYAWHQQASICSVCHPHAVRSMYAAHTQYRALGGGRGRRWHSRKALTCTCTCSLWLLRRVGACTVSQEDFGGGYLSHARVYIVNSSCFSSTNTQRKCSRIYVCGYVCVCVCVCAWLHNYPKRKHCPNGNCCIIIMNTDSTSCVCMSRTKNRSTRADVFFCFFLLVFY